tara:strand:- start:388 stop:612 length:225 start_codon:yes stop_codon:yes gene_type:complete
MNLVKMVSSKETYEEYYGVDLNKDLDKNGNLLVKYLRSDGYEHLHGLVDSSKETWRTRANNKPMRVVRKCTLIK